MENNRRNKKSLFSIGTLEIMLASVIVGTIMQESAYLEFGTALYQSIYIK